MYVQKHLCEDDDDDIDGDKMYFEWKILYILFFYIVYILTYIDVSRYREISVEPNKDCFFLWRGKLINLFALTLSIYRILQFYWYI